MTTSAVEKREKAVEYVSDTGIRVKITYPNNVPETIRQHKINRMYEILSGESRTKDDTHKD
jgi:hypothetical protein